VHTLQWLRSKDAFPLNATTFLWQGEHWYPSDVAALSGHYSMIKYLYELNQNYIDSLGMRREAVQSGSLQLVKYLVDMGIDSWHPEDLHDAEDYMPDCLTTAGEQVSSCLRYHTHSPRSSGFMMDVMDVRCTAVRAHSAISLQVLQQHARALSCSQSFYTTLTFCQCRGV
jgi:hypothetical protein